MRYQSQQNKIFCKIYVNNQLFTRFNHSENVLKSDICSPF